MDATVPFLRRPVLSFRVGVTGTRVIAPEQEAAVRAQVAFVLSCVRATVDVLRSDPLVAPVYDAAPLHLRLVSPLAPGADRLVAEEALAQGYELTAPLPFPQEEYEADFPATIPAFRYLLAQAGPNVLELDGGRGAQESRSYEAVGRLVVRHSDLLIAVWDGTPAKGKGGTAEIVRYAARHGQPVWWINPLGGEAVWVESLRDLQAPPSKPAAHPAAAALNAYIRSFIRPPARQPSAHEPGGTDPATHAAFDHLSGLFKETARPKHAIWNSYRGMLRLLTGQSPSPAPAGTPAADPPGSDVWAYWQGFYEPTDQLAVDYGDRYRSSYVLVFVLAAFAVVFAVCALAVRHVALPATAVELIILLLIGAIVAVNVQRGWHSRLIGYRLMAELFRKQQALAALGWSLPAAELLPEEAGIDQLLAAREAWVGWYFNAALRAAPLTTGRLGGATLAATCQAIQTILIDGQMSYHARRRRQSRIASQRLDRLGKGLFAATFIIVGLKLILLGLESMNNSAKLAIAALSAGMVAAILPALSACFVGIRGYAELELLADASAQMEASLQNATTRIARLDLHAPLASQDLALEVLDLAQRMLVDIQGWAQLFRLKAVEPS